MDEQTAVAALADQEGWQRDGAAARVHYRGETDQYSVEFYEDVEVVLYWLVVESGQRAVPVGRESVPSPLRERVRADLAAADVNPDVEQTPV